MQIDAEGRFSTTLWLGQGPAWSSGSHRLIARETASGRQVGIAITFVVIKATTDSTGSPSSGYPGTRNTPAPPVSSGGTSTPGISPGIMALSNTLTGENDVSFPARLAYLNPLARVIGICYLLSLLLLGIAGLLRRHR